MQPSRLTADVTLPRVPKQDRSRRKQEALLVAAAELFADPGFEHVTADDIAAHAGFGTGTFYNYFANKTQAFLMVAGRHEHAVAPTLQPVGEALAAGASIHEVARDIVQRIVADRSEVPWLRRTWLRLALTDPDVHAVQRRLDREWDAAIASLIEGLVATGRGPMPAAGARATATVVRVLVDAVGDEVVLTGTLTGAEAAEAVADLFDGLLSPA